MSVIHFNSRTRMAPALRHLAITNSKRIDLCPSYHSGLVENSFKPLDPHARKTCQRTTYKQVRLILRWSMPRAKPSFNPDSFCRRLLTSRDNRVLLKLRGLAATDVWESRFYSSSGVPGPGQPRAAE
jgi:hypothetical protein